MPEGILAASHFIAGRAPGLTLHVRNKRPLGIEHFAEDRVLVLVHGATYGVETGFDLEIGGFSWMDWMAARGFDVYAVDVRGYGQSTRPAQMDAPSKDNPPFAFTTDAIEDLAAAVDFVKARRNLDRVGVIGWSWGIPNWSAASFSLHRSGLSRSRRRWATATGRSAPIAW